MTLCAKLRPVDIAPALKELSSTPFLNTRGSNGHVAMPLWLDGFVEGLGLGIVMLAQLRKLPAYQGIPAHIDAPSMSSLNRGRRFHIPLITHPAVTMRWPEDGEEHHLEAGWLYEVDYTKLHEIVHRAPVDRIHVQVNAL